MRNSLLLSTILLYALTPLQSLGASRTLGDCFEVVAVTPSRVINHEVDLQGPFDDGVVETFLTGPQLFAHAIGFGHAAAQDRAAFVKAARKLHETIDDESHPSWTEVRTMGANLAPDDPMFAASEPPSDESAETPAVNIEEQPRPTGSDRS